MKNVSKKLLGFILASLLLAGCDAFGGTAHEHTFSSTWSSDDSKHWKDATCEHNDLVKDFGEHIDLDEDGNVTFVILS